MALSDDQFSPLVSRVKLLLAPYVTPDRHLTVIAATNEDEIVVRVDLGAIRNAKAYPAALLRQGNIQDALQYIWATEIAMEFVDVMARHGMGPRTT